MRSLLAVLGSLLFLSTFAPGEVAYSQSSKLEGQIVCCTNCWAREDRTKVSYGTTDDLQKAAACIGNGDPTLLAVIDTGNRTTFYQLEDGRFHKPGNNWLDFVGKRVEIAGPVRTRKDVNFVKVDALKVLAEAPAASEQIKDLFGADQKLSSYRGRIVVLNFWATYCVPCRKEMPDLAAIQNQYAALGVQVIGASADPLEDQKKVLQFIKETKVNFPVWLGATTQDMALFGLGPGLPGTAIIGRDGKIMWLNRSIVNEGELRKQIDAMLSQAARQAKKSVTAKAKPTDSSNVPS